jgi:UDP-N-acetylmuramate--alanine ligase
LPKKFLNLETANNKMNLGQINNVYFIGIGGIGMSALARYFNSLGKTIAGYDRAETVLTRELTSEGMNIHYSDNLELIPLPFRKKENTLVIITPAIPSSHAELNYFRNQGFEMKKRAEVLGIISQSKSVIGIAGTHGKTTTSTMVSHLLRNSKFDCNAFLGGISLNYNTNLLLSSKSNFVVVEADEFDRSFLHLHPQAAIVTSIDADHLDIYGNYDEYKKAFADFIAQIKPGGFVVLKKGLDIPVPESIKRFTYSLNQVADYYAKNIIAKDGFYTFDLITPCGTIHNIKLGFPGLLNVENAVAAMAMVLTLGSTETELHHAMESFLGVKRRFEYYIKTDKLVLIDDYGHHPEELRYTIESVKELFPGKKVTGIFQPHLYSRTNDFADEFAKSLSLLDDLILLDIYPAREKPIPGVNSEMLLGKVTIQSKTLCSKDKLVDLIKARPLPEVLLMMGAGDIDHYIEPVKKVLLEKTNEKI